MSGRDVQPEQGVIGANLKKQRGPLVDDEKVVGQGSQAGRSGLAFSRQGGGVISGYGDSTGVNEEEAQQADMLAHGIRGMEEFGKMGPSPWWSKREDFGA